jgi:hypothetical protein
LHTAINDITGTSTNIPITAARKAPGRYSSLHKGNSIKIIK